jgi:NADH dehydrogenase
MSPNVAIQRPRVVIIGAGFGGLSAAKSLAKAPVAALIIALVLALPFMC